MIIASHLTKRYGPLVAVDDVSFGLRAGTVTGFLGPNGAGKSTTLRMLCGLVHPTSGGATVAGVPYRSLRNPPGVVGTLLDASAVHPGRTGRAHLRLLAAACGIGPARVDALLDVVGLADAGHRRVGAYSLGMRQRLGLAGALLADPPALLLDEPATGLDPDGIRWLRGFLRGLAAEGRTVLLSSHLLGEVDRTVDRVILLHAGRVVADDAVDRVVASVGGDVYVRSPDLAAVAGAVARAGWSSRAAGPDALVVSGAPSPDAVGVAAAQVGASVRELRLESDALEAAFFALTAGATDAAGAGAGADRAEAAR